MIIIILMDDPAYCFIAFLLMKLVFIGYYTALYIWLRNISPPKAPKAEDKI